MAITDILIAGVDEVGRGPLAGAVVAAAVILPRQYCLDGLTDSKKLSAKKREQLSAQIKQQAVAWAIGEASVSEIDKLNIHHASLLAMQRACLALSIQPHKALIDGKFCPQLSYETEAIIQGDSREPAISAASIIAKVTRDAQMSAWHEIYPQYGFAQHAGYGTKQHLQALAEHGACAIHRRSFKPIKNLGENND